MEKSNMLDSQAAMCLWTRDGFVGPVGGNVRAVYPPDFTKVTGPHAPRRAVLAHMSLADESSVDALPTVIATSAAGLRISASGRRQAMPFVVRNVECDEVHFIQSGNAFFQTEFGAIEAQPGDFVFIPRAIAYRFGPTSGGMRSLIVESPWPLKVSAPFGIIAPTDIVRAVVAPDPAPARATSLFARACGDVTRFELPYDPTAVLAQALGEAPVWKVNLAKIQRGTFSPVGGPPVQFMTTQNSEICIFNLSSRVSLRPPVHLNADYDEFITYADGPGAWGGCSEPGTITWVPKGVPHQGPDENVPEGYLAWLMECRPTLRWTEDALRQSELMETDTYGPHRSSEK